jgi:dihydrofolate reductase
MRRVRYSVATSLDGFIAGPNGEADWIIMDPEIDFSAIFAQFDTLLMGRRTWEAVAAQGGGGGGMPGMKVLVFSRTLKPADHPKVTIVADAERALEELRAQPGKDIWLFGGGALFRELLALGQVDTVELGVIPVLLGGGIPLLPAPALQTKLTLTHQKVFSRTGIVWLEYAVGAGKSHKGERAAAGRERRRTRTKRKKAEEETGD